ncbi:MAG: hypothetical protein AB1847_22765 [bacterium]
MFPYDSVHLIKSSLHQKAILCLAALFLVILLPDTCPAEDYNQKGDNYFQSLPDKSFVLIDRKPDGAVIRLLPHHDEQGKLIVPWLEDSMGHVFELDPNHQAEAREHLLKDYYEKE